MTRSLIGAMVAGGTGLAVAVVGGRVLPLPGGWSVPAWERWWTSAGPLVAVFSLARVVLIAGATAVALAFGAVAATVAVAAGGGRERVAGRVLSARRWPAIGPLLRLAMAAGAVGPTLAGCGSAPVSAARGSAPAAPTLTNLGSPDSVVRAGSPPVPSLPPPVPSAAEVQSPPPPVPSPPARARWVVRPGDSLWSIAEATVGAPPGLVAAYWVELVELNRPTLPDPDDPSLLFSGDVVDLPPLRAPGR